MALGVQIVCLDVLTCPKVKPLTRWWLRLYSQAIDIDLSRIDLLEEFQDMVDEYNAGSTNVEAFFAKLTAFTKRRNEEEKRGLAERLTEEELVGGNQVQAKTRSVPVPTLVLINVKRLDTNA